MSLSCLDTYMLRTITNYISVTDLINLYITGNKFLNQQLISAIRSYTINITIDDENTDKTIKIAKGLSLFSKLTHLKIYQTSNRLRISETPSEDKYVLLNLPPLSITSFEVDADSRLRVNMRTLPRSLTHLDLRNDNRKAKGDLSCILPNLTYLNLRDMKFSCADIDKVPRNLTYLKIFQKDSSWKDTTEISNLPQSLIHLIVKSDISTKRRVITTFPSNITYLALINISLVDQDIRNLPRCLTYLNVIDSKKLTDNCVPNLPRGLTHLNLLFNNRLTNKSIPYLPRGLTHLDLNHNEKLTDKAIPYLPRGLTLLDLNCSEKLTDKAIPNLPRGLTHLDLGTCDKLTDKMAKYLPRRLTYLELASNTKLTDRCVIGLPDGLLYLSMQYANITGSIFPFLPRGLCCLMIKNNNFTSDEIKQLPSKLVIKHIDSQCLVCMCKENVKFYDGITNDRFE